MISKNVLELYVEGVKKQSDLEDVFHKALRGIENDNYVVSLICYEYQNSIERILEEQLGQNAYDHLMWWMWDCKFGRDHAEVMINGVGYNVSDFDKFYDLCIVGGE